MTGVTGNSSAAGIAVEILVLLIAGLLPPLFLVGLGYRFWRWVTSPDETTARKLAARREKLKQTVRRPAEGMPLLDSDEAPDATDPALNGAEDAR
jgi:hypothetical protein